MKYFKPWLQEYIVESLPSDEGVVEALNKKAFEVEEVLFSSGNTVFDIKVLPNRAHDALGHRGMAKELCADFGFRFKDSPYVKSPTHFDEAVSVSPTTIEDSRACTRFMSIRIDGIAVKESSEKIKTALEGIGQRSINNIVDFTNYVQFSLNKPMHAYDARSIKGTLTARFAREGETLDTLDDKTLTLDTKTLVIADDEKVLGLAGIKGGKHSGIKDDTTSIIIESANFNPNLIRTTSQKYGYKTDASKRFENGLSNGLVEDGLWMTVNLIKEAFPEAKISTVADVYPKKDTPYYVGVSLREVNAILGTTYKDEEVTKTLNQLLFPFEKIVPETYIKNLYPTLIGKEYKNPSSMRYDAPDAFSCSSLISYLYKGVWMPSISIDKYVFSKKITREELSFGDLVFANSGEGKIYTESLEFLRGTKVEAGIDHVGMYLGDNTILHATKKAGKVVVETLEEFESSRKIIGYGRVVENLSEERYVVNVPDERLDIRIQEDLAEEIGRIIGYDTITPTLPTLTRKGVVNKRMYYENLVREILFTSGFSEICTYTFGDKGDVSLVKGLAQDKEKLRNNLGDGVLAALSINMHNSPLLKTDTIRVFEFGTVFTKDTEVRHLALAVDDGKKKSLFGEEADFILSGIKEKIGCATVEYNTVSTKPYCIEIDFDALIDSLPEPKDFTPLNYISTFAGYVPTSPYPFIVRDIAVWTPSSTTWADIEALAKTINDTRIVSITCFDTFTKTIEGKGEMTSYAFRFVIQSNEKTLTDEDANGIADKMYSLLKDKGYEIR